MATRVLEIGDCTAAGYCGRLFVQAGVEVLRVDTPRRTPAGTSADEQALDFYLHADKRRVCVDYDTDVGRGVLAALADRCDVVLSDLPPSDLDQLGWHTLGSGNPGLVRVSISPFGLSGPYRNWQGFGPILLAMGGYTYLMGDRDRAPLTLPGNYAEYQGGQYAYIAAQAALWEQRHGGDGTSRAIEISLLETVMSLSQFTTVMWSCGERVRERCGNAWSDLHPICLYPCKDGWFLCNVLQSFWEPFTRLMGRPELADDPRFADNAARVANRDALDAIVVEAFSSRTMQDILEAGQRTYRIPTGVLMSLGDLLGDPHLRDRHYFRVLQAPDGRRYRMPASAYRFRHEGCMPPQGEAHVNPPTPMGSTTSAALFADE